MKIVVRVLAALAVIALATPALACDGAKKQTTTASAKEKARPEKKADAKAEAKTAQAPAKPAPVQN
jgi:Flp pilus assembly protein TadB